MTGIDRADHPSGRGCPHFDDFGRERAAVHGPIHFAAREAKLDAAAQRALAKIAAEMLTMEGRHFIVVGHAAPTESDADTLSERRANAVVDALVRLGVPSSALEAHAAGATSAMDAFASTSRYVEIDLSHTNHRDRAWDPRTRRVEWVQPRDLPCDAPPTPPPCR